MLKNKIISTALATATVFSSVNVMHCSADFSSAYSMGNEQPEPSAPPAPSSYYYDMGAESIEPSAPPAPSSYCYDAGAELIKPSAPSLNPVELSMQLGYYATETNPIKPNTQSAESVVPQEELNYQSEQPPEFFDKDNNLNIDASVNYFSQQKPEETLEFLKDLFSLLFRNDHSGMYTKNFSFLLINSKKEDLLNLFRALSNKFFYSENGELKTDILLYFLDVEEKLEMFKVLIDYILWEDCFAVKIDSFTDCLLTPMISPMNKEKLLNLFDALFKVLFFYDNGELKTDCFTNYLNEEEKLRLFEVLSHGHEFKKDTPVSHLYNFFRKKDFLSLFKVLFNKFFRDKNGALKTETLLNYLNNEEKLKLFKTLNDIFQKSNGKTDTISHKNDSTKNENLFISFLLSVLNEKELFNLLNSLEAVCKKNEPSNTFIIIMKKSIVYVVVGLCSGISMASNFCKRVFLSISFVADKIKNSLEV